ncbi:MAG: RNA methyltransferase [Actinobacteria bacterium]|nr:RNA methyltransferase [Actinomycetota bacterium]
MIRDIAGRQNHSVKLAQKLQRKNYRREHGLLVAEGMDLLAIAVESEADLREVLVRQDLVGRLPAGLVERAEAGALNIGVCSAEVLSAASSLGGAADVVFVCGEPQWSLGDLDLEQGVVVYLQEVGDPGNVGTLVRSCVAFGSAGLVCSPGTADPYGPKAMRAGMGAQFLLPLVTEVNAQDLMARLEVLRKQGAQPADVLIADSRSGEDVAEISRAEVGAIIVLGAERRGPGNEWRGRSRVRIPQARFDSLNVAMAGTILLYELHRAQERRVVAINQPVR